MDLQHSEVEGLCRFRYTSYYIQIQILISIRYPYIILYYQFYTIFINLTTLRSYWCRMRNMSTWNSFPFIALRSCIWKRLVMEEVVLDARVKQ